MTSSKTPVVICSGIVLIATGCFAQSPTVRRSSVPRLQTSNAHRVSHSDSARSKGQRFLTSDEGRAFLKATGHPLAPYAIAAFGEPAKDTVIPPQWMRPIANAEASIGPATDPCTGNNGARFNLEPRANAFPQNEATADFLPNRIGSGDDLIVQGANDWRGNLTNVKWDGNVSGYYVHRSTTADCSTQFEGGLPTITVQGSVLFGIGGTVVAADPERDAIFMADQRFGSLSGVGLFRAAASTLLNSAKCPNGTHLEAQATSCWTVTPPVLRDQRQPGQRPHRPVRAQHRIGQLEQLIRAGGQAGTEICPEPRQHGQGLDIGGRLKQAVHHGLRGDHVSFGENK